MNNKCRLAYLVTHPIQYQTPLLRRIAQEPDIDLKVFFCSDFSVGKYRDPGFDCEISWDVDLLSGYKYEFLPSIGDNRQITFWRPFNHGLLKRLKAQKVDVLWVHGYARWFHLWAITLAKLSGIKVLIRDEANTISNNRSTLNKALKFIFFHLINILCDGFLAIGSLNRQYYLQNGISPNKIFMMPYAVDNKYFQARAELIKSSRLDLARNLNIDLRRPVILYVSKLSQRKRINDLLKAYILLSPAGRPEPKPYLLIIGEGEARSEAENKAKAIGWDSIKFIGFKNQSELPAYFDLCDVFVLPSVYEPWGLVVNEAMNAGKAVIVSDQVGCGPDLVQDGRNGFVFKAGDVHQLSEALKNATSDRERSSTMGVRSREIIDKWGFEQDIRGLKQALGLEPRDTE